jgi:hypothetical protein
MNRELMVRLFAVTWFVSSSLTTSQPMLVSARSWSVTPRSKSAFRAWSVILLLPPAAEYNAPTCVYGMVVKRHRLVALRLNLVPANEALFDAT